MTYYTGDPHQWPAETDEAKDLPAPISRAFEDPRGYMPDDGLVDAVNVALTLGQPLLLTGEPGTGKTQLAYSVAKELGLPKPIKFEVKSTTEARDLFYSFDHLRQFRDVQVGRRGSDGEVSPAEDRRHGDAAQYLSLRAMGLAIVLGSDPDEAYSKRLLQLTDTDKSLQTDEIWQHAKPTPPHRSLVLIDEIDKAPRDVPNDILNEIELYEFTIPELDPNFRIRASSEFRPVIILTSNSEKDLPAAFLRRCVYYDIPFPWDTLRDIVENRMAEFRGFNTMLDDALELLGQFRQRPGGLDSPPGTAELLAWLKALLSQGISPQESLQNHALELESTLSVIVKNKSDQAKALGLVNGWLKTP